MATKYDGAFIMNSDLVKVVITRTTSELIKSLLSKVFVHANIIAYAIIIHILAPITVSKDIKWHIQCEQKSLGVSAWYIYVKCVCYIVISFI